MTQLTRETITLAYDPTYGWVSIVVDPDGTAPMLWLYTERTGEIRDTGGILAGLHPVIPPLDKGGSYREDQVYRWAGLDCSSRDEIKDLVSNVYDCLQGMQTACLGLFAAPGIDGNQDARKELCSVAKKILSEAVNRLKALLSRSDLKAGKKVAETNTRQAGDRLRERIAKLETELSKLRHLEKKYGENNDD
jgi:BMFP domain-containing protein YqiC